MVSERSLPRVLVITQYYSPDPNFITQAVATRLAEDADVTVLTSHPNYPAGRFAAGHRYWRPERCREGNVTVWRLPMIPNRSHSVFWRALSYLSFTVPAMIAAPFVAFRATTVWVYQTPFTTALAAWFHKYVRRARIVFTVADLWPESFVSAGVVREGALVRASFGYRRWINRWADLIICSTRGTRDTFELEGTRASALECVPIWVEGIPESLPPVRAEGESRIVYAGNLGPAQSLDTLVRAAALVRDEAPQLRFEIYGMGSEEDSLRRLAASLGATNVKFMGSVSPQDAFRVASTSMAQVVSLRPTELFRMTIPSKLVFSFATGTVILAGLEGESESLATESGGAIVYQADSAESLAEAIRELLRLSAAERKAMGERLQTFYEAKFHRGRSLERYRELLLGP